MVQMPKRTPVIPMLLLLAAAMLLLSSTGRAVADTYPTNTCVARKLVASGDACEDVLEAMTRHGHSLARAATHAGDRLTRVWDSAEKASAKKGVDCTEVSGTSAETLRLLDSAGGAFVSQLYARTRSRKCATHVLHTAGNACEDALRAEADLVADPNDDPRRGHLKDARRRVRKRLLNKLTDDHCFRSADAAAVADALDGLVDRLVLNAADAPHVPAGWTMYSPDADVHYNGQILHPICSRGTPYSFWAHRGTVNKLVVYYQGGGACFSNLTCSKAVGAFKDSAGPGDDPNQYAEGIARLSNPNNPFRNWNSVFVSYCTGDVHWGDATITYPGATPVTINHRGAVNARVVEKWAREHFVNPDEVFVSGSSAGAYGAIAGAAFLLENVYRASRFNVVGDAGNGVVTQEFVSTQLLGWGIEKNLPRWIAALDVTDLTKLNISDFWAAVANFYPRHKFGQYTSAYDGGNGSQTFFYNVMVQGNDLARWLQWWLSSCDWHAKMRAVVQDTAARAGNFRYYIGAGSRHTIWGSDKIYTETKGGVTPFIQWVQQMRTDDKAWANQECTDCSLNPGDPRPNPLVPPFGPGGAVTCPAS